MKLHFLGELKIVHFQPLKHHLQPLQCQLLIRGKHQYVIQVTQETEVVLITKDGHHHPPRECGWAVEETLWQSVVLRGECAELLNLSSSCTSTS